MLQNQKFAEIFLRNEDWLLAKTFNSSEYFQNSEFSESFNFPWRKTISGINKLILDLISLVKSNKIEDFLAFPHKESLLDLSHSEANENIHCSMLQHNYIYFLKVLLKTYISVVNNSGSTEKEKKHFINYISNLFGSYELVFIKEYEKVKSLRLSSIGDVEKSLLQKIINNLSIPAIILDSDLNLIILNNKVTTLFNTANSINLLNRILYQDKTTLFDKIKIFIQSEIKEETIESKVIFNNKTYFLCSTINLLSDLNLLLIAFIDFTKWKDLEHGLVLTKQKAIESDRLKTAFLANMSHEIRTPMNAIVGFSELLIMSKPNSKERIEYLNLIRKSSNDLLNIIEDVIDVAKIESKQLKIVPIDTNLKSLTNDLKLIYSELLKRNEKEDVKLVLFIPDNEKELTIKTDPKRLKQILSNLINNAIKFTDSGTIEFGYKLANNKHVYFFVKDTGIGIPYKLQNKIFERFVQVEESLAKNISGTGLGLTISKNLVNLLGGNIWATSKPGFGSIFYFYIPYIKSEQKKNKHDADKTKILPKEIYPFSGSSILIAEDEDINFYYLKELFKEFNVTVVRAKNGLEAINIIENNIKIDLILMDVKMPEVNGIQATRYINRIRPEIPIIAITAFAMDNDREACIEAGCVDYISKPIKREKLLYSIQQNLKVQSRQM